MTLCTLEACQNRYFIYVEDWFCFFQCFPAYFEIVNKKNFYLAEFKKPDLSQPLSRGIQGCALHLKKGMMLISSS